VSIVIAVIGRSDCSEEDARAAETIGRLLAQHGATVVCGGLTGVMEAVCRGARSGGGFTVGILPGNNRSDANQWVDLPIVTGVGQARNIAVVRSAHAVIAVGGSYGTLSEISFALNSGIPVVGLASWRLAERGVGANPVREVSSAEDAVETALRLARGGKEDMQ
jgi:uncharacterized protein (TIGR00725 family)